MASPTFSWASKVRQFRSHLGARVRPDERAALGAWLTPGPARPVRRDARRRPAPRPRRRRHARAAGASPTTSCCSPGSSTTVPRVRPSASCPRVAWSLGEAWGPWVVAPARRLPGLRPGARPAPRSRRAVGADGARGRLLGPDRRAHPAPGRSRRADGRRAAPSGRRGQLTMVGLPDGSAPSAPPWSSATGAAPEAATQVRTRGVRGPARAPAVADRGAPSRRPDGAARRARRGLPRRPRRARGRSDRQRQRVRRDRRPADPDQEPRDAAATGRSGDDPRSTRRPIPRRRSARTAHRLSGASGRRAGAPGPARSTGSGCSGANPSVAAAAGRLGAVRRAAAGARSRSCSLRRVERMLRVVPPPPPPPETIPRTDHHRRACRAHPGGPRAVPTGSCSRSSSAAFATGS